MPPPVRVKIYGLSLTKRGYFLFLGGGVLLCVALLALWLSLFAGSPPLPADLEADSPWPTLWSFLRDWLPAVLLVAMLLEAVEVYVVLRRFRRAEAEQAAGAPQPEPPVKGP